MGIRKNKTSSLKVAGTARATLKPRRRGAKALPKKDDRQQNVYLSLSREAGTDNKERLQNFTPEDVRRLHSMLDTVGNYVKGHLDTTKANWSWDDIGIVYTAGTADYSDLWKTIADQCHGASSLIQTKHQLKAFKTMQEVYHKLAVAAQQHDPWVLVYLWKILLSVRGISYRLNPPNASFLKRFINYLWGLYFRLYSTSIPLVGLFTALADVPLKDMKFTIELLYKRTIRGFEDFDVMKKHPVVFSMWGHFHRHYTGEFHIEAFDTYQPLARRALGKPHLDARSLTIVSDYMLARVQRAKQLELSKGNGLGIAKEDGRTGTTHMEPHHLHSCCGLQISVSNLLGQRRV